MKKALLFVFCLLSSFSFARPKLDDNLKKSYIALINESSDLHRAVIDNKPEEFRKEIEELQNLTARLIRQITNNSSIHHQIHAYKVLEAIEEQVAILRTGDKEKSLSKTKNMKRLFYSFSELALAYDLKKEVKGKMFYCSTDKSMWFQGKGPTRNPSSLKHRNCGQAI